MPPASQPSERLRHVLDLAIAAGKEILRHYPSPTDVVLKEDRSPLTSADTASHERIVEGLATQWPGIPIVSEESAQADMPTTLPGGRFWLVDPLDGTKEFLKQSGDFTVNIALMDNALPILGVVHAPARGISYLADVASGSWRGNPDQGFQPIHVRAADPSALRIVASRDHAGAALEDILRNLKGASIRSIGSALKFCLVAEGLADVYPRWVPTMEWDTAAAQCVVEAAGGQVVDRAGNPLRYAKPAFRNPSLLTYGDARQDWRGLLSLRNEPIPAPSDPPARGCAGPAPAESAGHQAYHVPICTR